MRPFVLRLPRRGDGMPSTCCFIYARPEPGRSEPLAGVVTTDAQARDLAGHIQADFPHLEVRWETVPWHGVGDEPLSLGSEIFVVLQGSVDNEIGVGAYAVGARAAEALTALARTGAEGHIRLVRAGDWLLGGPPGLN